MKLKKSFQIWKDFIHRPKRNRKCLSRSGSTFPKDQNEMKKVIPDLEGTGMTQVLGVEVLTPSKKFSLNARHRRYSDRLTTFNFC